MLSYIIIYVTNPKEVREGKRWAPPNRTGALPSQLEAERDILDTLSGDSYPVLPSCNKSEGKGGNTDARTEACAFG